MRADELNLGLRKRLAQAEGVLLDWDGCIAIDGKPDPAALRLIAERPGRVAIASNNSTHLPEDFSAMLARWGVSLPAERVILAGVEALKRAHEIGAQRVMVVGDGRMKAYGHSQGLNIVQDNADLIVLLRDPRFTYTRLERAANALKAGAQLIIANPDVTHPGRNGRLVPETGALLAALIACVGAEAPAMEIIGKPNPRLFERACRALQIEPQRAVMIGDNPATDIAGAHAFGLTGILIGAAAGLSFDDLLAHPMSEAPRRRASKVA